MHILIFKEITFMHIIQESTYTLHNIHIGIIKQLNVIKIIQKARLWRAYINNFPETSIEK